ncbi:MAG: SpoIIIAH-like family protein [Ruminococcaceae bacterium]|nr:SpoIIIAH-like family protein [Oscillospiraceae bacterium]
MKNENSTDVQNNAEKKAKPILTEEEIKKRKSKRTRVATASFVLLLAVGILGNWYFDNNKLSETIQPLISSTREAKNLGEAEYVDAKAEIPKEENEYFATARVERQNARDEAIDKLQSVLDKTDESEQARQKAAEDMAKLSENISNENKIETLVTAKGVNNCLAVISTDGTKVDIIVDSSDLSDTLVMQIKDIAIGQLNCSFEDVSIIQST